MLLETKTVLGLKELWFGYFVMPAMVGFIVFVSMLTEKKPRMKILFSSATINFAIADLGIGVFGFLSP